MIQTYSVHGQLAKANTQESPCKVPAGYHLVRLMKTESGSEIVHPWIPSVGFELYLLVLSNPGSHVQCVSLGLSLEIEAS